MDCRDCQRFNVERQKCRDGKVNPPRWEIAFTVAQTLGLRAICPFNDHREKLIRSRRVEGTDEIRGNL